MRATGSISVSCNKGVCRIPLEVKWSCVAHRWVCENVVRAHAGARLIRLYLHQLNIKSLVAPQRGWNLGIVAIATKLAVNG
jgi:hypothetical protein